MVEIAITGVRPLGRSSRHNSWLQNFCRIATAAAFIGLGFPPQEALAGGKICPQFLAR
jgi:hypothetical protein